MDIVKVVNSKYILFEIFKLKIRFNEFFKHIFYMKHVKLGTLETIVHRNATTLTMDSGAGTSVIAVHQIAI